MASSELARPDAVVVDRVVDAAPDDIVDHLTDFALSYGLAVNRRRDGDGLVLTRDANAPVAERELFRTGDEIRVAITPAEHGTALTFAATMTGLHRRGDDWKRGRAIRGGLLSAFFAWLGVRGITPHFGTGDVVMFGLSGWFAMKTVRAVSHEEIDRTSYEDDVHRALAQLCDRIEDGELS